MLIVRAICVVISSSPASDAGHLLALQAGPHLWLMMLARLPVSSEGGSQLMLMMLAARLVLGSQPLTDDHDVGPFAQGGGPQLMLMMQVTCLVFAIRPATDAHDVPVSQRGEPELML